MTASPDITPRFVRADQDAPAAPDQIVLVPGTEVPMISLDLPAGLRGAAREQVARRQLSDRMGLPASDVQMRPFAPKGTADAWTRILITDPGHLAQWKSLGGRAVLPDYLALPCDPELWCLDQDQNGTIRVRLGAFDGFSARPALTVAMLDKALGDGPRPKALFLLSELPQIAEWADAQNLPVARTPEDLSALDLPAPNVLAHDELSCDLRADPLAARVQLANRVLPWRWPLLAGLVAATLFGAVQIIQTRSLQSQTAQITQQTQQDVQRAFPGLGPLLDIRLQVSRALADRRGAATPDTQLNPVELGRRVAQVTHEFGAVPQQLSYTAVEGVVLILRLPDFAATEGLGQALRTAGMQVDLVDSRASTDTEGVRAEYRIQPQEASQ
ncbi:type II secretion system protein GspL [Thalassovita sp.]|uniref:type II secretion system protein GspL n=1 Tax=Thalassovita sp. TaxID=1979401 RepID=UPI003B5C5FEF